MDCSQELVERWRLRLKAYVEDRVAVTHDQDVDQQRSRVQQEMTELLHSFLDGAITLNAFNTAFQQRIHHGWNVFHLQGTSGGMFLNKLVEYVPSEETFGHLFRLMVRVPEETVNGRRQMQAFVHFIEGLIASDLVTRAQLQPARVPFLLSAWWHIQDPQHWPIFYLKVRQALLTEQTNSKDPPDPIEAYFVFRERFLALAQALGISSWKLEHLAAWSTRRHEKVGDVGEAQATFAFKSDSRPLFPQRQACVLASRTEAKKEPGSATGKEGGTQTQERAVSCRTHLQWLLAKLGHKVGCRVWIAASDHRRECQHELLGNLSLPSFPVLANTAFQPILRQIDVLWLRDNDIVAAYEIEQAHTDVATSLLRLYDLGALFPERHLRLCVVAPQDRFEKVQFELSRPAFRGQDLRKRCALISEEMLLQQEAHILRWASSPAVIEELICSDYIGEQR